MMAHRDRIWTGSGKPWRAGNKPTDLRLPCEAARRTASRPMGRGFKLYD